MPSVTIPIRSAAGARRAARTAASRFRVHSELVRRIQHVCPSATSVTVKLSKLYSANRAGAIMSTTSTLQSIR
jgi:hypothetical protein